MVSIIKNQLLKHLSRFTKNLSADKINLSTFKGEGELSNLELNEIVLTDLLELPSWLRLTKAWCNRVYFRIPWTKLKSVPIHLHLDEVNITVETCEELRSMSAQGTLSSYAVPGKYSYVHKIIDGITVTVNTVNILFNSPAFTATIQVSTIVVDSKAPDWTKANLQQTRIKESNKGQLLIFKELSWQTLRIEAKSTKDKNLTPLKLLTNQARIRIVIKKRLSDCFIMGSRLVIILDDLLWALTDSQLKAALHFLDSLTGLVQKATQITRKAKAARKLEELPEYQAQLAQEARSTGFSTSKRFTAHDVVETSYHFLSDQINLHLCEDAGSGCSSHPSLKDGGALQVSVKSFQVDYYPYHLAKGNRQHWPTYNRVSVPHTMWQEQALSLFKSRFMDLIDRHRRQHHPVTRQSEPLRPMSTSSSPNGSIGSPTSGTHSRQPSQDQKHIPKTDEEIKKYIEGQLAKLMTSCVIMRIKDFTLYKVTSGKKQTLKEFISASTKKRNSATGDRSFKGMEKDASIVHAEFIYYYYPNDIPFPLPPPKFYVHLYPIRIVFDVESCVWLNAFGLTLYQSLMASKSEINASHYTYIDVKVEAIMPRVTFQSSLEYPAQRDRPKILYFQVTRVTITNTRSLEQSSRADLAKCVDSFHMGSLFFGSDFPSLPTDFYIVTQKFLDHISASDNIRDIPNQLNVTSLEQLIVQLCREFLWVEAKDVWYVHLDPVYGDFLGARAVGLNKPVTFLDAVPVTVWLHTHMDPNSTVRVEQENKQLHADIHALAHISNLISVQLNHYQFLFLLRLAEEVSELATFLSVDASRILKVESTGSLVFGAIIPQLEITFVMPSQCPGKESSGGDVESFVPDSSSIADDMFVGSTATVWQNSTLSIDTTPLKKFPIREDFYPDVMKTSFAREYPGESAGPEVVKNSREHLKFMSESGYTATKTVYNSIDIQQKSPEIKSPSLKNTQQAFGNNIQNNFNASFSSMKRGFGNLMSSIDSALKPIPDDASDTTSIRSDESSDTETYEMIGTSRGIGTRTLETDADFMFFVFEFNIENKEPVELASEVIEEESTPTSTSDHSLTSSCRRKDLVSVATFKLTKVEFLQQSVGHSSSIKVQVGNISNEDCASIPWDELQTKFSSRSKAWSDNPRDNSTTPRVKLRLDHTLALPSSKSLMDMDLTDRDIIRRLFHDMVTITVSDLSLDLSMSTALGLADLAEDEIIPVPIPMQISLDNVKLHMIEDRPPVNITSPGPVPIDLNITQLYITRSEDGTFNILPCKPNPASSEASLSSAQEQEIKVNRQLQIENEELKRRLVAFERVSEENRALRKAQEEPEILRSCLSSAQAEIERLLKENERLLDEIGRLREQQSLDRARQLTSKR